MKLRWFRFALSICRLSSPKAHGFTLLELLITLGILGIVAAIAIPSFINLVDETKINLLTEQVRQSLREAQQQALSEGQSYAVILRTTPEGLQVGFSPVNPTLEPNPIAPNSTPPPPAFSEPQTWQKLKSSIPPNQLIVVIPGSLSNSIVFTSEGDIEFPSRVFLAMGNPQHPRVNTRRCINIMNSESGGSYFQVDKDVACDAALNTSPTWTKEP